MNSDMKPSSEKIESSALLVERNDTRRPFGTEKRRNNNQTKGRYHRNHCGKNGNIKGRCWKLHPHLKTTFDKNEKDHAAVADTSDTLTSMNQLTQLLQQINKYISSEQRHYAAAHASGSRIEEDDW